MTHQTIPILIYRLDVKRPVELLRELLDVFVGDQTFISFEGDLSYFDTRGVEVISKELLKVLPRNHNPNTGKIVLLLNSATKDYLVKQVLPKAGVHSRIWHILITVMDQLVFASYDNFDDGGVWVTTEVGEPWVNRLVESKIIRRFEIANST